MSNSIELSKQSVNKPDSNSIKINCHNPKGWIEKPNGKVVKLISKTWVLTLLTFVYNKLILQRSTELSELNLSKFFGVKNGIWGTSKQSP